MNKGARVGRFVGIFEEVWGVLWFGLWWVWVVEGMGAG